MKDCTTCKYGYKDERLGIPMCYHPKRFSEDCIDFNMYEEKEIKEPKKPVQKDLEDAAKEYCPDYAYPFSPAILKTIIREAFIAGAKWQAKQLLKGSPMPEDTVLFNKGVEEGRRLERDEFENNRLAACNNQTKEEYNRETDFALEIIKKEHRQPTFSDAINYGMQLQKGQMMKETVEGEYDFYPAAVYLDVPIPRMNHGDKVRVIVCKKEDKKDR